jgi:hypothetical protein
MIYTNDVLVETVAEALYKWDRLLFTREADRYGAAKVAVETLRNFAETKLDEKGNFKDV